MSSRKAPAQQEIDEEYLRSLMAAPEPAASSSDTEVSEQAETPASEPRVRRSDAEDYASRFLKNTVGNFIDNVLEQHFERHRTEIRSLCSKGLNKIL